MLHSLQPQTELYFKRNRKPTQKWFDKEAEKSVLTQVNEYLLLRKGYSNAERKSDGSHKLGDDADYERPETGGAGKAVEENYAELKASLMKKVWKNGGSLRDYQAEGIAWLYKHSLQAVPEARSDWRNR